MIGFALHFYMKAWALSPVMAAEKALKGLFSAFINPLLEYLFVTLHIMSDMTCQSCIHFELH